MTKEEWIEFVIDDVCGGDPSDELLSKYHPEIVSRHIETVYNEILGQVIKTSLGKRNYSMLDSYATPFSNVEVKYDSSRAEYYFDLPKMPVKIEGDKGIRLISAMKDQTFVLVRRDNAANFIYDALEVSHVSKYPVFYVELNQIRLVKYEVHKKMNKLLVKLVLPFSRLEYDAEVPVPDGRDDYFLKRIRDSLLRKRSVPQDEHNDQNTTTA